MGSRVSSRELMDQGEDISLLACQQLAQMDAAPRLTILDELC